MLTRKRATSLYFNYKHDAWNRLVKVVSDSSGTDTTIVSGE